MRSDDIQGDAVLATLRELSTYDVPAHRAQRLRTRCHHHLALQHSSRNLPRSREAGGWRTGRVLAGVWCVLYVFEILRFAAAVYGF
jgi:hypothetical protein